MKAKGKEYADRKRRATPSDITEGDSVLAKRQVVTNKLNTTFEPTVFKVVKRSGSEATIINTDTKTTYRRNVAHLKQVSPDFNHPTETVASSLLVPSTSSTTTLPPASSSSSSSPTVRPQRERRAPARYAH